MIFILWIIGFIGVWICISFNWRGWKTNLEILQLKKDKKSKIITSKSYKSVGELLEDLNKKEVWYKEVQILIRVRFEQFLDIPLDVYRYFKRGLQRWSRGWADEDVWGD